MRVRGFTLIELMIVVAIIAIIASVAIPSLLNSRKSANEARAIATLRTINTAQEQYKTRFGQYAGDFDDLENAGYFEIRFDAYDTLTYAAGQNFWSLSVGPDSSWDADRYFFIDVSGVIRVSETGEATSADPPVD